MGLGRIEYTIEQPAEPGLGGIIGPEPKNTSRVDFLR